MTFLSHGRIRLAMLVAVIGTVAFSARAETPALLRVGLLHSLVGDQTPDETPVRNAALLALEEINAAGGINGALLEPVIADGASDDVRFRAEAERLVRDERVAVIVGCPSLACRRAVLPVVEKENRLLIYPLPLEGMEESPHVFQTGALPNQRILPALRWAMESFGPRAFLVGSDEFHPRAANLIIRQALTLKGGTVTGERYLPLGSDDVAGIVAAIAADPPDVLFNTVVGVAHAPLFDALKANPATAAIPVVSFSLSEAETALAPGRYAGSFLVWGYFQSLATPRNGEFLRAYAARFGPRAPVSDPAEAAYIGLHLWANAVREAGTTDLAKVRRSLARQSYDAPQGVVSVSRINQSLWRAARIGRVGPDGHTTIVWSSGAPLRPTVYPRFRTPAEWRRLLVEEAGKGRP